MGADGTAVCDFMPFRDGAGDLMRVVEGERSSVAFDAGLTAVVGLNRTAYPELLQVSWVLPSPILKSAPPAFWGLIPELSALWLAYRRILQWFRCSPRRSRPYRT